MNAGKLVAKSSKCVPTYLCNLFIDVVHANSPANTLGLVWTSLTVLGTDFGVSSGCRAYTVWRVCILLGSEFGALCFGLPALRISDEVTPYNSKPPNLKI